MSHSPPDPSLVNILNQHSLRWIFVGGKGGVGKTTCSSSLAVQLAKVRERVLIISTDPAHNVSDTFDQKFSQTPTLIKGFTNLYAMEIDPTAAARYAALDDDADNDVDIDGGASDDGTSQSALLPASMRRQLRSFADSLPGVDEFMTYTEVLRLVRNMNFSVVVFDTAPTGHTLRLLSFPEMMERSMGKILSIRNKFGPMLTQISSFFGMGSINDEDLFKSLEERLPFMRQIVEQFKNAEQTTFICVCIPEFLSVFETERLVQELANQGIDTHNIIVNQLLLPGNCDSDGNSIFPTPQSCKMCSARRKQQAKYLEQIEELYEDFHITRLPALECEVRGVDSVKQFSRFLIQPCKPLLNLVEVNNQCHSK